MERNEIWGGTRELYWGGTGALKSCNHVTPEVHYDFLFTTSTYSGVLMSNLKRLVSEEADLLEKIEAKMKVLNYNEPYMIFKSYQMVYPEILETRVIMTQFVTDDCRTLGAIWFDDGTKDLRDSMWEVYNKIDWKKAREFDY